MSSIATCGFSEVLLGSMLRSVKRGSADVGGGGDISGQNDW